MDLKNIIVATDMSDSCGKAAKWAQNFKEQVGAERLIVQHVIQLGLSTWMQSAFDVLEDPTQLAAATAQLADWFRHHAGAEPDEVVISAGSSLVQITELVNRLDGETLLVMSKSAKGAVKKFIVGSTVQAVASQPPCPLAIVHPGHTKFRTDRAVIAATDMSPNAQRAVAYAASIVHSAGGPLEIIHAIGATTSPLVNLKSEVAEETMVKVAAREIGAQPELQGLNPKVHVVSKAPADAILEHASDVDSDLVVLGHSGESLFVQSVLGSVAQRVLNNLPTTMIIVPSPTANASDDSEEE